MRLLRNVLTAAALMLGAALPASAATIIGGGTAVTLTSAPALTGLGLSFAPIGTASASTDASGLPVVTFLITGGSTSGGESIIAHNGSGLRFTAGSDVLDIGDFLIDTDNDVVRGFARANGALLGTVNLFTFDDDDDLVLELAAQAATAFTSVFGAPDLTGTEIGIADPNVVLGGTAPIPEPEVWAMMLSGFLLIGGVARRRSSRAVLA